MCTQESWLRMLAISKRYLFKPASIKVSRNRGSWVMGVQAATTTRLRLCSSMISGHTDLGVLGAGEQVVFHVDHVGQRLGVFRQRRHVDDAADVDAAVADEHPDAGGVFRFDVLGCGRLPGLGLGPADVPQGGAHRPGRGGGLHDRLGNVLGTLHGPADIDARPGGGHRREGRGGHKIVARWCPPPGSAASSRAAWLTSMPTDRTTMSKASVFSSPLSSAYRMLQIAVRQRDRCCGCGSG